MTILEMCLEKLFDKNEEIVCLVYCQGGHSLIWSRLVCDAEKAMVFKVFSLKQGI